MPLGTIFIIVALILFVIAALPVASPINLGWLGMAFLAAAALTGARVL